MTNIFGDIFDDCPKHSIELTKQTFGQDFNINLEDIIKINDMKLIGSGSIGQVYKTKLNDGRIVAIKVKHPDSDNILNSQKFILNFIAFIQKYSYIRKKLNLHFNIVEFINDLHSQIHFNNEVYNCLKLRKKTLKK